MDWNWPNLVLLDISNNNSLFFELNSQPLALTQAGQAAGQRNFSFQPFKIKMKRHARGEKK